MYLILLVFRKAHCELESYCLLNCYTAFFKQNVHQPRGITFARFPFVKVK